MKDMSTFNMLMKMHLNSMAKQYKELCENAEFKDLDFEEKVAIMVEAAWINRKNNRINRMLKNAQLKHRNACPENIEYHEDRNLNKELILRLVSCNYIEAKQNVIIVGLTGSGKTWLSCALGFAACRMCHSVKYIRLPELIDKLTEARSCGVFRKTLHEYVKPELLIIDEWLTSPLKESESRDILEIIESRNSVSSTILCSQSLPEGWHKRISKGIHADAILDRVVHNAHHIRIEGKLSMRERKGLANNPN